VILSLVSLVEPLIAIGRPSRVSPLPNDAFEHVLKLTDLAPELAVNRPAHSTDPQTQNRQMEATAQIEQLTPR
jgi:hypothetical protein